MDGRPGSTHVLTECHVGSYPQNLWITLCVAVWKGPIHRGSVKLDTN